MQNYIKIFQEESKYLLNSYKDKDLNAIERCQKVFGNRTDLSLMNMQHVIAKEYGFNQWNDLRSASNSEQAQALTIRKGENFTSPLTRWFNQNTIIPEAEDGHSKLRTEDKTIDWENFTLARPFDSIDLSFMDVSGKNLSKLNLLDASFTDATIWPKNKEFLPKGINPEKFLEERKDSGLGIKALHKAGIKGKGRNIVLISEAGLGDHIEYHHNLMDYIEISDEKPMGGFRGNTDASGLVGKTCGLAPEAHLYVISVGRCGRSFLKYAQAIQKACEIHQNLIKNHQNGIDVIVMRTGINVSVFEQYEGYQESLTAIKEAEDLGIFVLTGENEHFGYKSVGTFCTMEGNIENPKDYDILPMWAHLKANPELCKRSKLIFFPSQWTVAGEDKMNRYVFRKVDPFMNTYIAGLYVLAKSVKETLTPQEFFQTCYETGSEGSFVGNFVNSEHLINSLKKRSNK